MDYLGQNHFLTLPRPDIFIGPPAGVPDTTTLAAHDFDVDTRTGFMPPDPPIERLSAYWEPWEEVLDDAILSRIQLGDKPGLTERENQDSLRWRNRVKALPRLLISGLKSSEVLLRRAHLVLAWVMHFYIHSLPPDEAIRIPPPLTIPLLQVSAELQLPPVVTYSDDVLYNWRLENGEKDALPTTSNIRTVTTFTSTPDEAEFYLCSGRLELTGVEALDLMRSTMDEAFVGDDIAIRRITEYLNELATVIVRLREHMLSVKQGCNPDVFYHQIRPWFRGEDSENGRKWNFEGIEEDPTLTPPVELSGASAGQSSLIHALDIFLGVDKYSHGKQLTGQSPSPTDQPDDTGSQRSAFLKRMQLYMPRHHRAFLNHLSDNPRPLRELVFAAANATGEDDKRTGLALLDAYNKAVLSLKEFRDAHMIIVALYIIGPARRNGPSSVIHGNPSEYVGRGQSEGEQTTSRTPLKGTGGTDLVRFLKGVRDQTKGALMSLD